MWLPRESGGSEVRGGPGLEPWEAPTFIDEQWESHEKRTREELPEQEENQSPGSQGNRISRSLNEGGIH